MSKNQKKKRRMEAAQRKAWMKRRSTQYGAKPHGVMFYDVTLLFGTMYSLRQHDSSRIGREAVALFTGILDAASGIDVTERLPVMDLSLDWTSRTGTAALATFLWQDMPVTTSALLSGVDPAEDHMVAMSLQNGLLGLCQDTPFKPGFYLPNAEERPLLATFIVPNPLVPPEVVRMVGDAETCLAAAFFEKVLRGNK
jgi:hypothetical protein